MSDDLTLFDPPDDAPGAGELPQTHAAAADEQMVTAPVPPADAEFESDEPPPDHVLSGPIEPAQPEDVGPPSWDERWTDGSPPHVQAPQRLLDGLNEKQTTAAAALNGPVLVVAGPGSGKTRVVTHRLAALLDQQVPATRLLAMTFTNKAAEEMRNRVAELAGLDQDTVRRMWIGTFHSMCARLLRIHHTEAGLPRSFVIVDSDDQLKILRDLLRPAAEQDAAHDATTREVTQAATQLARDARDTISNAKARLLTPDKMADSPRQSEREFATTAAAYRDKLEELGAVDFDDLLVRAVQLLEDHPAVRNMWRRRFWFVHVDEYQDTSDVQHRLVRLMVGDHHNVCVVGDADQSIYGWRSARPELLNQIVEDYDDVTVVTLDRNYRSTKKIVDVAKAIIEPSPAKFRAELWTDNDDGKPVDLLVCEDDRTEAKQVTSRIGVSGEPYEQHAILFRTNAQSRLLEQQLLDRRIPYRVVGTVRFYDRAEVKDAIAWLRAATNPGDQLAFERAAQAPRRGIGDATLEKVAAYANKTGEPIVVAARQVADGAGGLSTRASNAVGRYVQLLTELGNAAARGPVDAVKFAIDECGVADHVRKTHKNDPDKIADKLANLDQLRAAAAETEAGGLPELDEDDTATASRGRRSDGWWQTIAFLEEAALASSADAEEHGVALMTVHAAKGREFDHVYVVGVEEDYFPHKLSQDTDAQIHEERRLLFVAVSRARKKLTVSYCTNRWTFGSAEDRTASRFLADLPQHVVVHDMLDETHGGFNRSNTGPAGSSGSSRRQYSSRRRTTSTSMRPGNRKKKRSRSGPKVDPDKLQVGTRVTHPKFGAGAVTKPGKERATIKFDDGTEKVMLLEYAPLKIVS